MTGWLVSLAFGVGWMLGYVSGRWGERSRWLSLVNLAARRRVDLEDLLGVSVQIAERGWRDEAE